MRDFTERVAVVTGGASGIGRGIAENLLESGAKVVIADVEQGALERTVQELRALGQVSGVVTDVRNYESVEALADAVYEEHGAVHLLFNNAGVGGGGGKPWEQEPNDWQWTFGVNVFGVAHGCIAFIPRRIAAGEGAHVVNTSSGNGGFSPIPFASVYAASKAAITSYTESVATQLQADGVPIRASVLYPSGGLLETGIWTDYRNRPSELARRVDRPPPPGSTLDEFKESMRSAGVEVKVMDLHELGAFVLEGIREERFVIGYGMREIGETLQQRAELLGRCELPVLTDSN